MVGGGSIFNKSDILVVSRGMIACPACWVMGTNEMKKCTVRIRIQNILYWADKSSQSVLYTEATSIVILSSCEKT